MAQESTVTPDALRSLRARYGWRQTDLAKELLCDYCTVNRWENGKHKPRGRRLKHILALIAGATPRTREKPDDDNPNESAEHSPINECGTG